jgi:hypothetical protein
MTYKITKSICIHHEEDLWEFNLKTDEYGTVGVTVGVHNGIRIPNGIHIPKDCIQHFIDALEQLK